MPRDMGRPSPLNSIETKTLALKDCRAQRDMIRIMNEPGILKKPFNDWIGTIMPLLDDKLEIKEMLSPEH